MPNWSLPVPTGMAMSGVKGSAELASGALVTSLWNRERQSGGKETAEKATVASLPMVSTLFQLHPKVKNRILCKTGQVVIRGDGKPPETQTALDGTHRRRLCLSLQR